MVVESILIKVLIKNKFKILNQFFLKILVLNSDQSSVQKFWRISSCSKVWSKSWIGCWISSDQSFDQITIPNIWKGSLKSELNQFLFRLRFKVFGKVQFSVLVQKSDQRFFKKVVFKDSFKKCGSKFLKNRIKSVLVLSSCSKGSLKSLIKVQFSTLIKILNWFFKKTSVLSSIQNLESILVQIVVQSSVQKFLKKWVESVLIQIVIKVLELVVESVLIKILNWFQFSIVSKICSSDFSSKFWKDSWKDFSSQLWSNFLN